MNRQRRSEAGVEEMSQSPSGAQSRDLDQLIKERKEEKRKVLKEKLQQKLKAIRDRRKSLVNTEPFLEGAFERLQTNNIWEIVLGYLTKPLDVTNAYFACRTFAAILEDRRKLMLLPKVLNVFKTKADEFYGDDNWEMGEEWCKNRKKICLDARGVSKAWKEIADTHLFDSAFEKIDWFLKTEGLDEYDDSRSNSTVFEDEESVDKALSVLLTYAQSHTPSCLLRYLQICVDPIVATDPVIKISELVQIHGTSLLFFGFQWSGSRNIIEAYDNLCDMLQNMPNVKGFVLQFYVDSSVARDGEAYQRFQQRLSERPFPALHSLEHLVIEWKIDSSLLAQILRKCVNLKSVNHSEDDTATEEVAEALMGLSLERYEGRAAMITSNRVAWPLKHLEITSGLEALRASRLFPAINRFHETLEHLRIWHPVEMEGMHPRLKLINLKSVYISSIRNGTMSLDDLLPLKSLEVIGVESVKYEDENAKVKVRRCLDSRNMDSSNVWQCFPYLRRFKVDTDYGFTTYYRPTPP